MKIEGSESISQRHGSADPDPDRHQNVMDPQPWLQGRLEDLAAQLLEAEDKVADLQRLADQSRSLKDEVDILRETSDKVRDGFLDDLVRIRILLVKSVFRIRDPNC
jgi:hypothetical protein